MNSLGNGNLGGNLIFHVYAGGIVQVFNGGLGPIGVVDEDEEFVIPGGLEGENTTDEREDHVDEEMVISVGLEGANAVGESLETENTDEGEITLEELHSIIRRMKNTIEMQQKMIERLTGDVRDENKEIELQNISKSHEIDERTEFSMSVYVENTDQVPQVSSPLVTESEHLPDLVEDTDQLPQVSSPLVTESEHLPDLVEDTDQVTQVSSPLVTESEHLPDLVEITDQLPQVSSPLVTESEHLLDLVEITEQLPQVSSPLVTVNEHLPDLGKKRKVPKLTSRMRSIRQSWNLLSTSINVSDSGKKRKRSEIIEEHVLPKKKRRIEDHIIDEMEVDGQPEPMSIDTGYFSFHTQNET